MPGAALDSVKEMDKLTELLEKAAERMVEARDDTGASSMQPQAPAACRNQDLSLPGVYTGIGNCATLLPSAFETLLVPCFSTSSMRSTECMGR